MRSYLVGGAVRDQLLGRPVVDRDYVVVGATVDDMLAAGYRPVGRDFPVFLHPQTHEEYALARTERKTAPGYRGFVVHAAPTVTLEEDLARRDLTINAMAMDEQGTLIDPFGGAADLRAGVLRHVSPAFEEDPVRILRVARFAARFGFAVAPETQDLMQRMVAAGEVDALVAERVWAELSRGLMEDHPALMIRVLTACHALPRIFDGITTCNEAALDQLERAAMAGAPLPVRFALLRLTLLQAATLPTEKTMAAWCDHHRIPGDCKALVLVAMRTAQSIRQLTPQSSVETLLTILEQADAFRRSERLQHLLAFCRLGERPAGEYFPEKRLLQAYEAAQSVDAAAIAAACPTGAEIPARIRAARLAAIAAR